MRDVAMILDDIERFAPADGDWLGLLHLLDELWQTQPTADIAPSLLRVFDRFPDEDGGVLWTMLHGLESLPGYEPYLRQSAAENMTFMKSVMLRRIENFNRRQS